MCYLKLLYGEMVNIGLCFILDVCFENIQLSCSYCNIYQA